MSASDSDNSIDWLASDDEDVESEPELDCTARPAQTPPLPSPSSPRSYDGGRKDREDNDLRGWGGSGEDSGQGSPASCTAETWEGCAAAGGLCPGAGHPERSKGRKGHKRPLSPAGAEHRERQPGSNQAEKNRLFSTKCMELQCYIHPLSSILNGLRTGRHRERLSSFQESLAMDRIQRIMGVLQNPCMGERYINIILKIEQMLKTWFPNIKPRDQDAVAQTEEASPAKKAKLCASGAAAAVCPFTASTAPSTPGTKAPRVTDLAPPGASPAGHAKWLHGAPPHASLLTAEQQAQPHPTRPLPPLPRSRAVLTQDSAVSSSTDSGAWTGSAPGRPSLAKISAPCLERLLKSTESIIGHKGAPPGGGVTGSGCC